MAAIFPLFGPLLQVSLGIALLFASHRLARLWIRLGYSAAARQMGVCMNCGYDLTGNTSGQCPECGTPLTAPAPPVPPPTIRILQEDAFICHFEGCPTDRRQPRIEWKADFMALVMDTERSGVTARDRTC